MRTPIWNRTETRIGLLLALIPHLTYFTSIFRFGLQSNLAKTKNHKVPTTIAETYTYARSITLSLTNFKIYDKYLNFFLYTFSQFMVFINFFSKKQLIRRQKGIWKRKRKVKNGARKEKNSCPKQEHKICFTRHSKISIHFIYLSNWMWCLCIICLF